MKNSKEFPFSNAIRITRRELVSARKAIAEKTGAARVPRGRPTKPAAEKYHSTSIRLHPKAIASAKRDTRKRGVGYQTVINEVLLEKAGEPQSP